MPIFLKHFQTGKHPGRRWMPLPQLKESAKPAVDRRDSKRRLVLNGPTFSSSDHNREKNMEGCRLNMAQTSSRNDGRKIERSAIIIFSTMNMKVYTSPYRIFDFLGKCHMLSCSLAWESGQDPFCESWELTETKRELTETKRLQSGGLYLCCLKPNSSLPG